MFSQFEMRRSLLELLIPWLVLVCFGAVMVGSAAVALQGDYLAKHLVFVLLGAVAFVFMFALPHALLERFYLVGWLIALAISVAVLIPGVGHEANGASRWLRVAGISIQAAEVAKFGLMIYLAGYLSRYRDELAAAPQRVIVPIFMIGMIALLLLAEPDFGSTAVILGAAFGVIFIAGIRLRYVALILLVITVLLALLIWLEPYRMRRLVSFADPWAVPYDDGYQLVQALIGFGRGEIFGLGLGESIQKLYYLPEAHNDFIFAVIAEELGVVGTLTVVLIFSYLVLQMLRTARLCLRQDHLFAGYLCYFGALVFGLQLLVNLGVNTGVLPTKGLTLPFISYGGSSLVVSCAMFGLIASCVRKLGATYD